MKPYTVGSSQTHHHLNAVKSVTVPLWILSEMLVNLRTWAASRTRLDCGQHTSEKQLSLNIRDSCFKAPSASYLQVQLWKTAEKDLDDSDFNSFELLYDLTFDFRKIFPSDEMTSSVSSLFS